MCISCCRQIDTLAAWPVLKRLTCNHAGAVRCLLFCKTVAVSTRGLETFSHQEGRHACQLHSQDIH